MNNNILKDYFQQNKNSLEKMYPGLSFSLLENDFVLSGLTYDIFILKLEQGTPLEHITGQAYFYNHSFIVSPYVLIPRSETEILVEKAVSFLSKLKQDKVNVLDVGTGTGNIIISIMTDSDKLINAVATDLSVNALNIAQKNYRRIGTGKSVLNLVQTDRLKRVEGKFDLIVSNPPYIKENTDKGMVHAQVLKFEPHMALFLKDSEYDQWFEELFQDVYNSLKDNGMFIMEGHEHHLKELKMIAEKIGFKKMKILKDYNERDRFFMAYKD